MTNYRKIQIGSDIREINNWCYLERARDLVYDLWDENLALRKALRYYSDLFPAATGDCAREALGDKKDG